MLIASFTGLKAQDALSFEEALAHTLSHNYDILMGQLSEEVADNNASRANNGFLPTVAATGGYNWNYLQGENELITESRSFDPNNAYNYNLGASINYSLFNGLGRKYTYLQAKGASQVSELQLQQTIQNTVLELSRLYFEVARMEASLDILQEGLAISKDRYKRASYRYEYGQAKNLDVLNAKVDVNTDSIALITGIQELKNLKRSLNYVMGKDIETNFSVEMEIALVEQLGREVVLETALQNNVNLKLAAKNQEISSYAIKASKSSWIPSLSASAGYNYRGSDDPNGAFLIGSSNYGPQAGISMSWSIFNGQANTQVKNAKLNLESSKIQQQSLRENIKSQTLNAYSSHQNLLFVLKAQADNVATAKDNFTRSEESYKNGQITSVAFRQAQVNLLNAKQALSKATYDAKNAEFAVLAMMGTLVE